MRTCPICNAAIPAEPRHILTADIVAARHTIIGETLLGIAHDFETALIGLPGVEPAHIREWLEAEPHVHWCACAPCPEPRAAVCPSCGLPPFWASEVSQ